MKNIIAKAKTILQIFRSSTKKTNAKFFIIPVLVLIFGFALVQPAYALDSSGIFNGIAWFAIKLCMNLAGLFIQFSIFILKFLIEIAGYNGYLDGEAVTVGWVMVRDVVNMFFVLILLIIAFGTILGVEQYEWKKMMVKFVMAAILVNFSRIICGVFIDFAQVFMITFVNGVAATAGGNLINMFGLDQILSLNKSADILADAQMPILIASIFAVFLTSMMAFVLGAYLVMLLIRMVVLWVLIILSPIAFVTSVLPQSQKYSQRWWSEFGNHVMVGPVIIFFVWLSFVTAGAGNIHDHVRGNSDTRFNLTTTDDEEVTYLNNLGVGEIMTWDKLANFLIAIGMLVVGLKVTNELGVMGGSVMSKAVDASKKAVMLGTGASAAMWAGKGMRDGGVKLAKDATKATGKYFASPFVDHAKMAGKRAQGVWNETLGARGLKRKGQLAKLDEGLANQEATKAADGKTATYWAAGDSTKFLGDSIVSKKISERDASSEVDSYVGDREIEMTNKEEAEIKVALQINIDKARAGKMDKVNKDGVVLSTAETGEATNVVTEAMRVAGGTGAWGLLDDDKKLEALSEASNDIEEGKITADAAALAGLSVPDFILRPQEEQDNHRKQARKDAKLALDPRHTAVATDLALKDGLAWRTISAADQRAYKKEAEFNIKAKKKLLELDTADTGLSKADKKQKAIVEAGDLQDSERGDLYEKSIEESGVPLYSSYLALGKAAQKTGKAGRLLEQSTATVDDMLRAKEGKMGNRLIKFEDAQYQSDVANMDMMEYDEKVDMIKDSYNQTAALRVKQKALKAQGKDLDSGDAKILKNSVQTMAKALASMYKSGDGEFLNVILEDLDSSFGDIELSDADNNHIRDIAFLTGASANDVVDTSTGEHKVEELQKLQEDARVIMREKEGALLRGLLRAKNLDASQNGKLQENHQLSVVRDQNGAKKIGFSNLAGAGNTGTSKSMSTGESRTGAQIRAGKMEYLMSTSKLSDIDGMAYISGKTKTANLNGVSKSVSEGYSLPGMDKKIETFFASATSNSINALANKQIYGITGGQAEHSSWDKAGSKFQVGSNVVADTLDHIFAGWATQYDATTSATGKQKIEEAASAFLSRAGIDEPGKVARIINDTIKAPGSLKTSYINVLP